MVKHKLGVIGRGYWGSKVIKYIDEFFDCLYYIGNNENDLRSLMEDESVRNVMIITPIETHYVLCKMALQHNKNVFCEKPITLHTEEAEELRRLADTRKLHLVVEYTHTFSRSIKRIADYCVSKYGPVKYYEMHSKHLGRFMEHNVYWLLASHFLAVLGMFEDLDRFNFVKKDWLYYKDICTTGVIEFEKGRIETSVNYTNKDSSATFYFDNATVIYNPLADSKNSLCITEYNNMYKAIPPELIDHEEFGGFDEKNNLRLSVAYFRDVLEGKAESNLDLAIKITRILENI